jgi:hypothetical protein
MGSIRERARTVTDARPRAGWLAHYVHIRFQPFQLEADAPIVAVIGLPEHWQCRLA